MSKNGPYNGSFVVVDFEFAHFNGKQKIIEIGAVRYYNFKKKKEFHCFINHGLGCKISGKEKKITHITDKELQSGISFPEAMKLFKKFIGDNKVYSWGNSDNSVLHKNLKEYKLRYKIDLIDGRESIFNKTTGIKRQFSVSDAVTYVGEVFQGIKHNALCDALNTAIVLLKCINYKNGLN